MVNLAIKVRHADILQTCRRDLLYSCMANEDETFYKRLVLPDDVTLDERRVLYAVPC